MSVSLAFALTIAFYEVTKKIADIAIEKPLIQKALLPVTNWLTNGYDEKVASEELRILHMQALDQLRADTPDAYDRLKITNWTTGKDKKTYQQIAAAALEMSLFDPKRIPEHLLLDLSIDESNRELFARYLFILRNNLVESTQFSQSIIYANTLNNLGLLTGLTSQITEISSDVKENTHYLEQLSAHFGLVGNEEEAMSNYLHLCKQQWGNLSLPLIRKNVGRFSPDIKLVFVPLQIRDEEREKKYMRIMKKITQKIN